MKNNLRAFTLIELLITSSIFLVVMLTIYSAFNTGVFGYRNIDENINTFQTARQILETIDKDLRNCFVFSEKEARFTGGASEMSFFSLVDSFREENLAREYSLISYAQEENRLIRLARKGRESLKADSGVAAEEMASTLETIEFSYGYAEAVQETLIFKETWDDAKALPLAVKVKLALKDKINQEFERTIYLPAADKQNE